MATVAAQHVPAAPMEQDSKQAAGVPPVAPAGVIHPDKTGKNDATGVEGAEARAKEARSSRAFDFRARIPLLLRTVQARIQGKVMMEIDAIADKTASLVNEVFGKLPQCILRAKGSTCKEEKRETPGVIESRPRKTKTAAHPPKPKRHMARLGAPPGSGAQPQTCAQSRAARRGRRAARRARTATASPVAGREAGGAYVSHTATANGYKRTHGSVADKQVFLV